MKNGYERTIYIRNIFKHTKTTSTQYCLRLCEQKIQFNKIMYDDNIKEPYKEQKETQIVILFKTKKGKRKINIKMKNIIK